MWLLCECIVHSRITPTRSVLGAQHLTYLPVPHLLLPHSALTAISVQDIPPIPFILSQLYCCPTTIPLALPPKREPNQSYVPIFHVPSPLPCPQIPCLPFPISNPLACSHIFKPNPLASTDPVQPCLTTVSPFIPTRSRDGLRCLLSQTITAAPILLLVLCSINTHLVSMY